MVEIWVPEKWQIFNLLQEALDMLGRAETVAEVEDALCDSLGELSCHVQNRAMMEKMEGKDGGSGN